MHDTDPLSVTNQCRMSNIYWAECFGPCGAAHVLQAMDRGFVARAMYSPGVRSHRGNKRRAEPTKQFIPFSAFWLRYQFNIWYGPCARFDIKFIYCGGEIATGSHVSLGCCIIALLGALQPKQSYKNFEFEMKWNWNQKAFHDTIAFMTVPWWSTETEYTSFGFWTFRWSFPFVLSRIENYL